jgi:hypothetical protein
MMKTVSCLIAAALFASTSAAYAIDGQHPAPQVNRPGLRLPFLRRNQAHPADKPAEKAKEAPKAPAAPPPQFETPKIAQNWAKQHGMPIRTVEVGPPERRVTRMFVPVVKKDWDSFTETFGNRPQSMMLVLQSGDSHMTTLLGGEEYLWARSYHYDSYGKRAFYGSGGKRQLDGKAVVIDLTPDEYAHAQKWFGHRQDPKDQHFSMNCGAACMDYIGNIEVAPGKEGVHQLRTIPAVEIEGLKGVQREGGNYQGAKNLNGSASIPGGKRLFDVLGIARSKDGRNMGFNLTHAASDRVQVIGVPIGDVPAKEPKVIRENGRVFVRYVPVGGGMDPIEHFKTMSDAELLGPLPPQGVAGVVRPVK